MAGFVVDLEYTFLTIQTQMLLDRGNEADEVYLLRG